MDFDNGKLHQKTVAEKDAETASLGINAKYIGQLSDDKEPKSLQQNGKIAKRQWSRNRRYLHLIGMAKLLPHKNRLRACRHYVMSSASGVDLIAGTYGDDPERHARFQGVQTCGSVWLCPCCSKKISETRRREINDLLAWARGNGYQVSFITLTFSHKKSDKLKTKLNQMKDALRRFRNNRAWKINLKQNKIGDVTSTECNGGGPNGWHPHQHMIVITKPGTDMQSLRKAWLASLEGAGLTGGKAAFDIQDGQAAGDYITKWGPAEELALNSAKKSKKEGGRNIWELQADAFENGDTEAKILIFEYAEAFEGRRQLVWSNGLKKLAGIKETSDAEAAQAEPDRIKIDSANISTELWKSRAVGEKDRRSQILDDCENHNAAEAVRRLQLDDHPDDYSPMEDDR